MFRRKNKSWAWKGYLIFFFLCLSAEIFLIQDIQKPYPAWFNFMVFTVSMAGYAITAWRFQEQMPRLSPVW
ncbi:MAG: hypothetical protein OHK0029_27590 [Armatimonadaceae bacterium]